MLSQRVKLRSTGRKNISYSASEKGVCFSLQPNSSREPTYICPVPVSWTSHSVTPLGLHPSGPSPRMPSLICLPDHTYSLLWTLLSPPLCNLDRNISGTARLDHLSTICFSVPCVLLRHSNFIGALTPCTHTCSFIEL